jgi:oxygen-independent coproporphyrinogen-3 oxidase
METYVDALLMELAHWGDVYGRPAVSSVYFGGGTPSLLPPNVIAALGNAVRRNFALHPDVEMTFEGNPETIGAMDTLQALKDIGVTRLSIGVQSLDDAQLAALGRRHRVRDVYRAVEQARVLGFGNLNLDLIFGLPGTRLKLWLDTLRAMLDYGPQHLSCYALTVEPDTPLERACFERTTTLPDEQETSKMFLYGADLLEEHGFLQYEISNFAKLGFQSRHNLGYWEGRDYLGLGPSAVSTVAGRRWANPADLGVYARSVASKKLDNRAERLAPDERIKEMVMLRLRTVRGLNLPGYRRLTGRSFMELHRPLVEALSRKDLVRIKNGYLRLTREGMLVSDAILSHMFEREETARQNELSE